MGGRVAPKLQVVGWMESGNVCCVPTLHLHSFLSIWDWVVWVFLLFFLAFGQQSLSLQPPACPGDTPQPCLSGAGTGRLGFGASAER